MMLTFHQLPVLDGRHVDIIMLLCRAEGWDWEWPFPTIAVLNSTTVGNARGIVTRHYNQPSDEYLDLFFRFHWETVTISLLSQSVVLFCSYAVELLYVVSKLPPKLTWIEVKSCVL